MNVCLSVSVLLEQFFDSVQLLKLRIVRRTELILYVLTATSSFCSNLWPIIDVFGPPFCYIFDGPLKIVFEASNALHYSLNNLRNFK